MAHVWVTNENGEVDFWAHNPYGTPHRGPVCKKCGLKFCIDCNPEFMESDCSQFMAKV